MYYTLQVNKNASIRVALAGASGYTGAELLRYLVGHPQVEIGTCLAHQQVGQAVAGLYPNLLGSVDKHYEEANWDKLGREHDAVFLCLPHGESQGPAASLLSAGCKVIDLGADFRLKSGELYESTYGGKHQNPELLSRAVYGLPEMNRSDIAQCQLLANPGCYPTASILALLPLLRGEAFASPVIIDAKSGVSGAGRSAKTDSLYCEVNENFRAYAVGNHRHHPEIEQALGQAVIFTPHLVPMTRGILATVYVPHRAEELKRKYQDFYKSEPFVKVLDEGRLPCTKAVAGSNFCHLAVCAGNHPEYSVILSAIDNLGKGAAGTALHNLNLMFGLTETLGLLSPALYP